MTDKNHEAPCHSRGVSSFVGATVYGGDCNSIGTATTNLPFEVVGTGTISLGARTRSATKLRVAPNSERTKFFLVLGSIIVCVF